MKSHSLTNNFNVLNDPKHSTFKHNSKCVLIKAAAFSSGSVFTTAVLALLLYFALMLSYSVALFDSQYNIRTTFMYVWSTYLLDFNFYQNIHITDDQPFTKNANPD